MEKTENFHVGDWLKDLPIPAENLAFKLEKIILCRKCERTKSPTRLDWFYRGERLEFSEVQSEFPKPNLRKLENQKKVLT